MQQSEQKLIKFNSRDVKIISKKTLFDSFFRLIKYRFQHKLFTGTWSQPIEREMFQKGNAIAVLPYDPVTNKVVIIEQIRVGALEHQDPWQLEIIAGIIDHNESSIQVAKREAQEEAGIALNRIQKIISYYPSASSCSEILDVYIGETNSFTARGIHGLDHEGENIYVHTMDFAQAYKSLEKGLFKNGASIIALQWLKLNYKQLRSQWKNLRK